jgi:transposase
MRLPVLGVDISQEWFDAKIPQFNHRERFEQNTSGFKLLLKRLKKHGITKARVCMEATGLYYEKLAEFLHAHGHEVVVVNPQCIKAFSRSELRRSKSDPLDAQLIASFCEQKYEQLHIWQPLPAHYKQVREMLRRRQALVDFRTAEKNRLKAGFSSPEVLSSIRQMIDILGKQIKELERLANKIIDGDPEFKVLVDLADSVGGVSRLTAAIVLVEVPRVLWSGRLAATFAGVIPSKESSGKSLARSYLSRVGSARLRQSLYMPAVVASQRNPVLKGFYDRLKARGLKSKQALTAVMRKLLHLIFGVLKTGKRFDPLYESKRRSSLQQA